jgi:ATP-binding cassette, subfamily B, bacterial
MSKTTISRIRNLDLFEGCTRAQLAKIDRLGTTLAFAPARALCVEGSPGAEFFVLLDGVVDVRTSSGTVELLRPGSWFGEIALIETVPRRATVTTRSESLLLVFGRREFNTLLAIAPPVRERLQRSAAFFAPVPASNRVRLPIGRPSEVPFRVAG